MLPCRKALAPAAAVVLVGACGRSWLPGGARATDAGTPVEEAGLPEAGGPLDAPVPTEAAVPEAAAPDANDASPPPVTACPYAPGLQATAPWATTRRCPGRTASTPLAGPQRLPTVAWTQMATTTWSSDPVIAADGTVYAIDVGRGVVAFTPAGSVKWVTPLDDVSDASTGSATVMAIGSDGSVYVVHGGVLDVVAPGGAVVWGYHSFCYYVGAEVAADGSALLLGTGCGTSGLAGLTLVTPDSAGRFHWSTERARDVSPPSVGLGGTLYFLGVQSDGTAQVFAMVPTWSVAWTVASAPLVDAFDNGLAWPIVRNDGSVVFADNTGLHALSPNGAPLWKSAVSAELPAALAAGPDGTVYASSSTGGLVAVSPDGATVKQLGGVAVERPIVDGDGTVYAATAAGIIAIASDGTVLWQTNVPATPLAIDATGTLYAVDSTGKVLSALR